MQKPLLFTPLRLRGVTAPNRSVVSPMVQYRATDGQVNDYHPGPSRQVCARQVRHRVHRELRHRTARTRHPGRSRHVGRRPDRGPQAAGALPQAGGRARRHADHPCRPQGQHAALLRQARPARPGRRRLAEMGGGRPLRAVGGRRLADPAAARHRGDRDAGAEVRRGRQARRCGGLRRHRDPRRARLSAGAVPVADQQHPQRPVWRRPRRPHALPARGGARGAGGLAGQQADVHPRLDGRRRGRLGGRGHRRLRQGA